LLGLKGEITSEDFEAVWQGLDLRTGEFSGNATAPIALQAMARNKSKARSLYDMTFSAPKSVSVMAIVGETKRYAQSRVVTCCSIKTKKTSTEAYRS
jgi:conjugative relaxase-like TrwC/TraI family protein